jgi:hypothetical protein
MLVGGRGSTTPRRRGEAEVALEAPMRLLLQRGTGHQQEVEAVVPIELDQPPAQDGGTSAQKWCEPSGLRDSVPGRLRPPLRGENPWARIDAGEAWCVRARATAWRGDLWDR